MENLESLRLLPLTDRLRLKREAEAKSAERAAAELLGEDMAAGAPSSAPSLQAAQKVSCGQCTRWLHSGGGLGISRPFSWVPLQVLYEALSAPERMCVLHHCGPARSVSCPTPSSTTRPRPSPTFLPRPLLTCGMTAAFTATAASWWIYSRYARLLSSSRRSLFGDRDLQSFSMKNLTEQGHSLTAAAERSLLGIFKEKLCYIACVYDTELKKQTFAETDREKTYELPDVNIITVGAERFHYAEESFQPSFTKR